MNKYIVSYEVKTSRQMAVEAESEEAARQLIETMHGIAGCDVHGTTSVVVTAVTPLNSMSYSEELEEIAFSKKLTALEAAADVVVTSYAAVQQAFKKFERSGHPSCFFIKLHTGSGYALFFGSKQDVFKKVRDLEDRESDLKED